MKSNTTLSTANDMVLQFSSTKIRQKSSQIDKIRAYRTILCALIEKQTKSDDNTPSLQLSIKTNKGA